jgi:hypothetical protein
MISVLIPTRNRPGHLLNAIRALVELADRPRDLELLLRADNDDRTDYEAQFVVSSCFDQPSTVLFRGLRHGYTNIHRYYNELARVAHGEWLMIWNDDILSSSTPGSCESNF